MKIRPVGACGQTDRQTDGQPASQTDRQPDRQTWRSWQSPVAILRTRLTAFCPHSAVMHVLTHSDRFPNAVNQLKVKLRFYLVFPGFKKAFFLSFPDSTHLSFCAEWPWSWGELLSICGMIATGEKVSTGRKMSLYYDDGMCPLEFRTELRISVLSPATQPKQHNLAPCQSSTTSQRPLHTTAIFPLDTANI